MDSTELEKLLREDFYDGESFRQIVNQPLLYGVAAWVVRIVNAGTPIVKSATSEVVSQA
jgi:hypothetical protein